MNYSKRALLSQKILLLILTACYNIIYSAPIDSSNSVVKVRNEGVYPFEVSFKRMQTYRSFPLTASGTAKLSRDSVISVTYVKPFKYTVTYNDTATITTGKKNRYYKNKGYKNVAECDPFHILMIYCHGGLQNLECKGSFDSAQVYSGFSGKRKCLLSLDRITRLWREVSLVNANGKVYERARFYYKKESVLPVSIVVETVTGKDVVKDSLVIGTVKAGR